MALDVVIVGGGPNGLMLACELSLAGVRPVVLERLAERSAEPKANGLVGQVVRFLDHRGLYERFGGKGTPTPLPQFMFAAMPLDLRQVDDNPLYALPIPQRRMEKLLEERAVELGVEIRRGHEVTDLAQDEDCVTVDVHGPDGAYRERCGYVVGCDGGHSIVRKLTGIAFPGVTTVDEVSRMAHVGLAEFRFLPETGELEFPGAGRLRAGFTRTERGLVACAMLEAGRPMIATVERGTPPADEVPMTIEELRASVRRIAGIDIPMSAPNGPGPHALRRTSGRNTRLAERYRAGRVFLAGDAAHVHSAMGGPGLNLGLQDVANLGWKLAAAVHGWAPLGLLDTYHSERHLVGERVMTHTQAQGALVAPGPEVTALRELFTDLLGNTDVVAHLAKTLAGADICYEVGSSHELAGRFVPELDLVVDGRKARIAELLRSARPVLLDLADVVSGVAAPWSDRVDFVAARCAEPPADALLIRPDGYVAWAASAEDDVHSGLRAALADWFGAPARAASGA